MQTVDLEIIDLAGVVQSPYIQVFDYGVQHDANLTFTQTVGGVGDNPGDPLVTGAIRSGFRERSVGNGPGTTSGTRRNRVTIKANRGLKILRWGVYGMAGGAIEFVSSISNNGQQFNMGNGSLGYIEWLDLEGVDEVWFEYDSNSDGNNNAFGPYGIAELFEGSQGGETYIVPGAIYIKESDTVPIEPGVHEWVSTVTDSNGVAGPVAFRFLVPGGLGPEITQPPNFDYDVGDDFSYQILATSPQGKSLTYHLNQIPAGLTLDQDTGLLSGNFEESGTYPMVVEVLDDYRNCQPKYFTLTVRGGDPLDLDSVEGPSFLTQPVEGVGSIVASSIERSRDLMQVYSKNETDALDQGVKDELRGGVVDGLDTLQKIALSMGNRTDLLNYILGLIQNNNGVDLTEEVNALISLTGLTVLSETFPAIGNLVIQGQTLLEVLTTLEAAISNGGGGGGGTIPDLAAYSMWIRDAGTPGQPSQADRDTVRTFLSLYTKSEVDSKDNLKFDRSKGENLESLTGLGSGAVDFGSNISSNLVSNGQNLLQVINQIFAQIQNLIDNGGGGSNSFSIPANTIAINNTGQTATPTGGSPGIIRAFLDAWTITEIESAINVMAFNLTGAYQADDLILRADLQGQINQKAAQSQVNNLVSLTGRPINSTNFGSFPNNILAPNSNAYNLFSSLGTSIKNLREGAGTWIGVWSIPLLDPSITNAGFTNNSTALASKWGPLEYRVIALSQQLEVRGCLHRPSGQGLSGTFDAFTVPNLATSKTRVRPSFIVLNDGSYRDATIEVTNGKVSITAGNSAAKYAIFDFIVPL